MSNDTSGSSGGNASFDWSQCNNYLDVYPDVCNYANSYYMYRINFEANAVFLAFFVFSCIGYMAVYLFTMRGLSFTLALVLGTVSEIIGYAGRIISWQNQWDENGFLMQICCLTIGPAFMAAGIYFCLGRIIRVYGSENSRIKPEWYPRIFIPCDLVSLVLQGAGGGMASVAFQDGGDIDKGNHIMMAGLIFQVVTMFVFMVLALDFAVRVLRRQTKHRRPSWSDLDEDQATAAVQRSWKFRGFVLAIAISTICIFWRCVFRSVELNEGWTGPLMARQDLFIGFEGVMITVAVVALNVFHPNLCMGRVILRGGRMMRPTSMSPAPPPPAVSMYRRESSRNAMRTLSNTYLERPGSWAKSDTEMSDLGKRRDGERSRSSRAYVPGGADSWYYADRRHVDQGQRQSKDRPGAPFDMNNYY